MLFLEVQPQLELFADLRSTGLSFNRMGRTGLSSGRLTRGAHYCRAETFPITALPDIRGGGRSVSEITSNNLKSRMNSVQVLDVTHQHELRGDRIEFTMARLRRVDLGQPYHKLTDTPVSLA